MSTAFDINKWDVQPLRDGDIQNLCDMGQDPPETTDYFKKCLAAQKGGARHIIIIRPAGIKEIVAYGMLNESPRYALYEKLDIPEIQDLFVRPQYRGQGIGRSMMAYLESIAVKQGYEQCGISVPVSPRHGIAQQLYYDCGYRPDGQGITYNRKTVPYGKQATVDDDLCLMLIKNL